jgi:phosphoribosyl 1,2-cyclic phosphodiesterase
MIELTVFASSSSGNCYLVEGEGCRPLLLDCGLPFKRIKKALWARDLQVSDLSACLITHEHGDHAKAVDDLLKNGIDVCASAGTITALGLSGHRLHAVKGKNLFLGDKWKILPFDTVHDSAEPLGYLISGNNEKLLYATDTAYIPYRFEGLNIVMVECNYAFDILQANEDLHPAVKKRVIGNHFGIDQVKKFLAANDLTAIREIHLIHLSDGNSDAERFKREIQELTGKPVYIAER